MKNSEFKNIIKVAVKEAIHEELKDILMEAIRSNKSPIIENQIISEASKARPSSSNMKALFNKKIPDYEEDFEPPQQTFRPNGGDSINGALPPGEVSMDQIMGLMGG